MYLSKFFFILLPIYIKSRIKPIKINSKPDITDQILFGNFVKECNFLPKILPNSKKRSWKQLINIGKSIVLIPIILPQVPNTKTI